MWVPEWRLRPKVMGQASQVTAQSECHRVAWSITEILGLMRAVGGAEVAKRPPGQGGVCIPQATRGPRRVSLMRQLDCAGAQLSP